ncbi:phage tail length tape measure family protein [Mesorhizobium sp. ESP-6-2]|uniref:phage tail length tape measure family protein n=1 Tax=Mesorhizobium sp. ESP-6-2 TaxID=2876625 RepID=UPI001CCE44A3|nr:phage tail length tape measure family protein [Mesorhizobium sp. ESP-6-2]MBZ9808125.1 phage tail length tape measure family protein [Mesorhizobium sp. ESP-6-2]
MADKTDDLLISVSTDLTTIKRQLKQLGQDIGQTTSGIQKQFDGLGKGIDQSLSPVQKRINDMMGIANAGAKPLKEWKGALADAAAGFTLTGKQAAISANQMLNLSRQGNDVITMFALGAHPMQIFASQAGQVYGALQEGNGGVTGSLKALGSQAVTLATKFPLATAAIAAAGVAAAAYLALGGSSIRSLDEILKSHEENIKRLGDAYDQVVGKQQKYAQVSAATAGLINDKDVADAKAKLQAAIKDIFSSATTQSGVGRAGGTREFIKSQFAPFEDAINELKNSAKDTTALRTFTDAVTAIGKANPNLAGPAQELLSFSKSALDAASAVETVSGVFPDAIDNVSDFQRALSQVDSKSAQKELQDLFDKAGDGKVGIEGIKEALAKLEQANPDLTPITSEILRVTTTALGASSALANMYARAAGGSPNGRVYNPLAQQVEDAQRRGASIIPTPAPNREDLGAEYDKAVAAAQRKADAAARRANRAQPKTADDRFAEDLQSIRDRTAALNEEFNSLGLSFEAQQKRKVSLDIEQEALKQVREEARKKGDADWQNAQLSPTQVKAIDQVSDAYARQADELRKAQDMFDLQRDVLKGAFDDLRSALDDGKLDWQDFATIAENALDKIIDKIENDLVDAILQANSAGGGTGFLGRALSFLTGSGSSGIFPSAPSGGGGESGIGLFDTGGFTGAGGKNQPAGIVHKGEYVFDQDAVKRIGVGNLAMLQRGYANGGLVGAPSLPRIQAPANQNGAPSITFAPTINMPNAQKGAGEEVTQALKKFEREFTPRVLKSLRDARTTGMI